MTNNTKQKTNQLKAILRGYRHMSSSLKKRLKKLGFKVEPGKSHFKVYYEGDRSHTFTMSVSASDHRSGLNMAHQLARAFRAERGGKMWDIALVDASR